MYGPSADWPKSKERDSHTELTFDSIKADIEERDRQDMEREIAPLKKADDAIEIDTSEKSIKSVVEIVEGLYLENKSRFQ
jgi:cytidylate kinase